MGNLTQIETTALLPPPDLAMLPPVNILIVDDRVANIVSLEAILASPDYNLITATSGAEALKYVLKHEFAVILLDVMMPEMDGFEFARLVKQRAKLSMTPIIFLTAIATDFRYLQEGYAVGAVDYLQKPLEPAMVQAKVAVFAQLFRRKEQIKVSEARLRELQKVEKERELVAALKVEERHYQELADALPEMVFTASLDGRVTYFNRRWYSYTGLSYEQSTNELSRLEVIHPDDRDDYESSWLRARLEGTTQEVELRFREASTGAFKWHLCRALPEFNSSGAIVGWLGTLTDIHKQKRLEMGQRFLADASIILSSSYNQELTLSKIAAGLEEKFVDRCIIAIAGSDGVFKQISAQGVSSKTFTRKEVVRSGALCLKKGCPILVSDTTGLPVVNEFTFHDGEKHTTLISTPIYLNGDIAGVISCVGRNGGRVLDQIDLELISELARHCAIALENASLYEDSQDANRRKDEFLAILSHELRTPLNAVLGWTEIVKRETTDETTKESLDIIERKAKTLSQLVADLLDVSRIITGKLELVKAPIEMHAFIQQIISTVMPLADSKKLRLKFEVRSSAVFAAVDQSRLQQVLWNLLVNAIKFTPDGGEILVTLSDTGTAEGFKIIVSDNGMGIKQELMPYIFDRFRQADSSTTRHYGGLGLGLAIVKHIVELHGGQVAAFSKGDGQGSSFVISIPKDLDAVNIVHSIPHKSLFGAERLDGTSVLVVDDDPGARAVAATFLKRSGATVRVASSVFEALQSIEKDQPDIVLTDIGMPEQDGFELIRQLQAYQQETGRVVRTAALSAYASAEDASRAHAAGFEVYLTKPINGNELVTAMKRLSTRVCPSPGSDILNG